MDEVCFPSLSASSPAPLKNLSENSINIFVWAVALLAHAACKSFGALLAVRFIMGICEGEYFAFESGELLLVGGWMPWNGELHVYFLPCTLSPRNANNILAKNRCNYPGIPHRHWNVLHPRGAKQARGVLVWVLNCKWCLGLMAPCRFIDIFTDISW